jgi:uncharacterized RDD family membrane protein YckC
VLLVLCAYIGGVVVVSVAWDLFFSGTIAVSNPPHWVNELILGILLVSYLTAGWTSTGRTVGKQMMGLRVVRSDGRHLNLLRAFLRAVLCAVFFPVLLLALVSRRNRGLEDVAFGTVVIYDWFPESSEPVIPPLAASQFEIEVQEIAHPLGPG